MSTEKKMDGMRKGRRETKTETRVEDGKQGGEGGCPWKSDVTPRRLPRWNEIYSVMFLSHSNEFRQKVTLLV